MWILKEDLVGSGILEIILINLSVINAVNGCIFFDNRDFAAQICEEAVKTGIVEEAKYADADTGVCCFYLNCDDIDAHKKVISYFLEKRLIKKTKAGKLHNISFKLNSQTRAGQYGEDFQGTIKLADFIDLDTGNWIK